MQGRETSTLPILLKQMGTTTPTSAASKAALQAFPVATGEHHFAQLAQISKAASVYVG